MARSSKNGRARRRIDPRLVIGLVLVVGSTAGVWGLVASLDDGAEVYAVRATVTPGQRLAASDFVPTTVRLGRALDRYVAAGSVPGEGVLVTRTIEAGELVPRSAVTTGDQVDASTVVVTTRGALPSGLEAGSLVDLWSAPATDEGSPGAPGILISGAEIVKVLAADGGLLPAQQAEVELRVTHDEVGLVLTAIAAGDALDLVAARLDETG